MRRAGLLLLAALLLAAGASFGQPSSTPGEPADPYDWAARERLAKQARTRGDSAAALYQAGWLAWLGTHGYVKAAEGMLREGARASNVGTPAASGAVTVVILAATARREVANACGNGVLPSQRARLEATVRDLIAQAEGSQKARQENDPVARIGLADLYLTLDDVLHLSGKTARDRKPVLQRAVTLSEAVGRAVPDAPGAHRLAASAWARLADLSNEAGAWDLAITACAHALAPDPDDPVLWELMWTLHLRAGHWAEAKRWQQQCQGKGRESRGGSRESGGKRAGGESRGTAP